MVERNWREKEKVIGKNLSLLPLCAHKLDCSQKWASAMKVWRLTALLRGVKEQRNMLHKLRQNKVK
jgi:hypothetical protein